MVPMTKEANPMMECGHVANGVKADGTPCCVICVGINPGYDREAAMPDLEGRIARCPDCGREVPSNPRLAFFSHRPTAETDSFYCGCRGWD